VLAADVGRYVGIDVSAEMIATARRRCAGLGNVSFARCSGRDLAPFEDGSFDLVLAVDSFPYLVLSGEELAERMIAECARVLRPGGSLVILNFSYQGDAAGDRRRLAGAAQDRFRILCDGSREFDHWDAAAFHLVRQGQEPFRQLSRTGEVGP
jgi:SAM-dependent methyltransferase